MTMLLCGQPTARAGEIKVVTVEVKNSSTQQIYAYIDNTGRHGKVQTDTVVGTNGQPLPPGLVIGPSANRSFGDAIGGGDEPTIHLFLIEQKDGKWVATTETEKASHNFKHPDDPIAKAKSLLRTSIKGEWTGTELKEQ